MNVTQFSFNWHNLCLFGSYTQENLMASEISKTSAKKERVRERQSKTDGQTKREEDARQTKILSNQL